MLNIEQEKTERKIKMLTSAMRELIDTLEWVQGCSSPAEDEIQRAIDEAKEVLIKTN